MAQKGPSIYNRRQNVKENRFCAVGKREHLRLRKGGGFQQRHKSLALKPWMQSEQKKQFVLCLLFLGLFICTFAWQALVISVQQTGIQG